MSIYLLQITLALDTKLLMIKKRKLGHISNNTYDIIQSVEVLIPSFKMEKSWGN